MLTSLFCIGHIELDIKYKGKLIPQRGFLVVKDSSDESTRQRKIAVPGIIGMNILSECTDILSDVRANGILCEAVTSEKPSQKSICGFARVIGSAPLCISANTAVVIPCTGPHINSEVVKNPLTNG